MPYLVSLLEAFIQDGKGSAESKEEEIPMVSIVLMSLGLD
jgi:hypothetical protein